MSSHSPVVDAVQSVNHDRIFSNPEHCPDCGLPADVRGLLWNGDIREQCSNPFHTANASAESR